MTKLEALKDLAAKVEAGELDWPFCAVQHVHGIGMNASMWEAYRGSLDAAKALHEAVLPRWVYVDLLRRGKRYTANIAADVLGEPTTAVSSSYSRALLLADLKALIAQEKQA